MRKVLKVIGIIIAVLALAAAIYVAYVFTSYNRIEDGQVLPTGGEPTASEINVLTPYRIVTQNLGFGAYTPDFTFFMDGGKSSWAASKDSVIACIDGAAKDIEALDPDFVLFQEVDFGSTRSYQVDERAQLEAAFPAYASVFAVNYHSAFLMYPFYQPHGASRSGILTLSRAGITGAVRRSLPISTSFSKLLDLDRCYSVSRIPVDNGKELVLYNVHSSAYGGSDEIRTAQMTMLFTDMQEEYENGNYCICGGDFNHDFTGDSTQRLNTDGDHDHGWAQPFPENLLPGCLHRCLDYDDKELIPTCRNCDVPYGPDCEVFVMDGFIISENVKCEELHNIDAKFTYSDHNPVDMTFSLQ